MGEGWSDVEAATTRLFSGVSNPSSVSAFSGQQSFAVGAALPFSRSVTLIIKSTRPYYWRGTVYDRFLGERWENTSDLLTGMGPEERITETVVPGARVAVQSNFENLQLAVLDPLRSGRRDFNQSPLPGSKPQRRPVDRFFDRAGHPPGRAADRLLGRVDGLRRRRRPTQPGSGSIPGLAGPLSATARHQPSGRGISQPVRRHRKERVRHRPEHRVLFAALPVRDRPTGNRNR